MFLRQRTANPLRANFPRFNFAPFANLLKPAKEAGRKESKNAISQEKRMLFFSDPRPQARQNATKPKTIADIKRLQKFVKEQKTTTGVSLDDKIKRHAARDETFNDFLRAFKAKNEQNWANIMDLTHDEREDMLLSKSQEYRKSELIMLEEFRRRKKLKRFRELLQEREGGQGSENTSGFEGVPGE